MTRGRRRENNTERVAQEGQDRSASACRLRLMLEFKRLGRLTPPDALARSEPCLAIAAGTGCAARHRRTARCEVRTDRDGRNQPGA